MEKKALIMDENAIRRAVTRITYEILERNRGAENLCIIGILSRGVVLAERIAKKIFDLEQVQVDFGALDITPYRDGIVIAEDKMSSLKRFKDDVKEVGESYECGITLEKFHDFKEGDIFEAFIMEEYQN